jgi:hypothetical protein
VWRFVILVPAYLFATSIPLGFSFGTNLEYEYAVLCSWLTLLLIPTVAFLTPKKYLPLVGGQYAPPIAIETVWILFLSPLFNFFAGSYLYISGSCECSQNGYLFWMMVQWYPAHVLAHAIYHAILRGRCQNLPKKKLAIATPLIYLTVILVVLLILWLSPQKRIVSLFSGFLHGPIYDSYIVFDGGIMLARTAHLLLGILMLIVVWFQGQTALIVTGALTALLWIISGSLSGGYPSTVNGIDYLTKLMPGTLKGDGYTVHYRPKAKKLSSESGTKIKLATKPTVNMMRMYRDAGFHTSEISKMLGSGKLPHVDIFVYPNRKTKKLWFGGGSTDVADVYGPSIHITAGSWPHPTLRHELVHALTSDIAFYGLGFHPNMAFTEGFAEALAPRARAMSLDEGAASILRSKRLPSVDSLFSPTFWSHSGSRAYTTAGSLINFLIDQYGVDSVKNLYSGDSWESSIKLSQNEVVEKWKNHIESKFEESKHGLLAEMLYRHPGVLRDRCPHSKADLRHDRSEGVYIRLRQPVGWDPEKNYLAWRVSLDSEDMNTRLNVWNKEIKKAAMDRFSSPGRLITWRETMKRARSWPPKTFEDVEMAITESDLARVLGDIDGSKEILKNLDELSSDKFLGASMNRQIAARIELEKSTSGTGTRNWRMYLAGWKRKIPSLPADSTWLQNYLYIRNDRRNKIELSTLEKYLALPPGRSNNERPNKNNKSPLENVNEDQELFKPSDDFMVEWYYSLGNKLMRKEAYQLAGESFALAQKYSSRSRKKVLEEHQRRAAYFDKLGQIKKTNL